jgi:hypothetical protein
MFPFTSLEKRIQSTQRSPWTRSQAKLKPMKKITDLPLMLRNLFRTTLLKRKNTSDMERWQAEKALSLDWEPRTLQIAGLVPPGSSVLEFGAGRKTLAEFLPDGCSYTPSDIVDRGPGTFVCDLNAPSLPVFPPHDVAVFSGVLEYVRDVPRLVAHLSPFIRVFILSYAILETHTNRISRRASGWVNDYDSRSLEEIFKQNGFYLDHTEMWQSQNIFRFVRG